MVPYDDMTLGMKRGFPCTMIRTQGGWMDGMAWHGSPVRRKVLDGFTVKNIVSLYE